MKTTERTKKAPTEAGGVETADNLHATGVLMRLPIALSTGAASLHGHFSFILCTAAGRNLFAASRIVAAAAFATFAGAHACFHVFSFAAGHVSFVVFAMTAGHGSLAVLTVATRHILAVCGRLVAARTCS